MADQRASIATFSPDCAAEIRRFYLFPEESYSLGDLSRMWRTTLDDVCAIFSDELATAEPPITDDPGQFRVSWATAAHAVTTFHVVRPFDIEVALGDDFDRVRESRWRTVPVIVHLPRFVVDALQRLPFLPPSHSITERVERLVCDHLEAEVSLRALHSPEQRLACQSQQPVPRESADLPSGTRLDGNCSSYEMFLDGDPDAL